MGNQERLDIPCWLISQSNYRHRITTARFPVAKPQPSQGGVRLCKSVKVNCAANQ